MSLAPSIKEFPSNSLRKAPRSKAREADYLAMMCHEIGTPLNVIMGLSHLLVTIECSPQKKKEYAAMLHDSSDMIMGLLKNMLYSAKIDADMVEMENIEFDLGKMVQEVINIITTKVSERGLNLHVHIAEGVPSHCIGDSLRIRQILLNLLSNAIKFTEKGHVALYVKPKVNKGGSTRIQFTVADTGIGIGADLIGKIFNKYAQAEASTSRKYGGTGLGLSISRDLAHLMRGEITVKSQPGIGSRFTLSLPLESTTITHTT